MAAVAGVLVEASPEDYDALASPYSLTTLITNLELSHERHGADARVTCVEYWKDNVYIGTSIGEIHHYVRIPGEDNFIRASKQEPSASEEPASSEDHSASNESSGVKQILVLPRSNKACILCNGRVTFHTLPELSPAQGYKNLPNCISIGARDLDMLDDGVEDGKDTIVVAMRSKCRLIIISSDDKPRLRKTIEYPGCLVAARRSRFACVADAQSYALLDTENLQKIPLFPISSSSTIASGVGQRQDLPQAADSSPSRSASSARDRQTQSGRPQSHNRVASLGNFVSSIGRRQDDQRSRTSDSSIRDDGALSPGTPSMRGASPSPEPPMDKPLPVPPAEEEENRSSTQAGPIQSLPPIIASPLPTEFLLTTGTGPSDRGVGVFVNCEGDVVRGTLEFARYPLSLVIDGGFPAMLSSTSQLKSKSEGYVLAAMTRGTNPPGPGLEIQRWDPTDQDSADQSKSWLALPPQAEVTETESAGFGVTWTLTRAVLGVETVKEKLKLRRFFFPNSSKKDGDEARDKQEDEFAHQFATTKSDILVWYGHTLSWAVRNPLVVRLDARLDQILFESKDLRLDQGKLIQLMASIRNQEATTPAEFLGLDYVRQKISLALFGDLAINQDEVDSQVDEHLLLEGGTDPRVMLSMVPLLREDIVEGKGGVWIHDGLRRLMQTRLASTEVLLDTDEVLERPEEFDIVALLKRYLHAWRQKKGFGSIADEVVQTVEAALLHILLHQDQRSSLGPGGSSSLRAELYGVVDQNVDCFGRAVELLEEYHRLYVLSRLYQSRNLRGRVLATWRRILEGERDNGGEFVDGEQQFPQYLARTRDSALFEEYGCWLAKRNPSLGVQVFTEDNSKVKLTPQRVVGLLRDRAPDAVKVYLEHLVFGKKNTQYANELISFYLDNVLGVLDTSEDARQMLAQSYVAYRALEAPRPTYRQFISDNAASTSWWNDRLRLLELLGGSHGAEFSYDVAKVLERIEPFEESLIPESIIIDGRQGRHRQALHLLTHGLGDYHTAINYCLLGGSSIFYPTSEQTASRDLPSREDQCALFEHLLSEFLNLEDPSTSLECTSELLTRFSPWFQVEHVLARIPDSWPVEILCTFLTGAYRRIVHNGTQAAIVKALSGVQNLRVSSEFIEKCETMEPHLVPAMDTPNSMA